MKSTAATVAEQWERMLREAAAPVVEDAARMARLIEDVRPAFAYAEWLA